MGAIEYGMGSGRENQDSRDPAVQLQALLRELTPNLEERLWAEQVPTIAKDFFTMTAHTIVQLLGVTLTSRFESLSELTSHYAYKDPKDVVELLQKVDRAHFDGGHVIYVGRGIRRTENIFVNMTKPTEYFSEEFL